MRQRMLPLKDIVREVCQAEPVQLAYLFGSLAEGKDDDESDIDIGIYADTNLPTEDRHALRLRLMRHLADILRQPMEKIDVVILQDVPVLLRYNVIRRGICIFERTRDQRIAYEFRVEQAYDDESYYLERESDFILRKTLRTRPS